MNKEKIKAKKSKMMNIQEGDLLYVRPSTNNMHQFVAKENSCFFDICLPNYSPDGHTRKVTYFKDCCPNPAETRGGLTELEYYTTPEIAMPEGFEIHDIDYRGSLA